MAAAELNSQMPPLMIWKMLLLSGVTVQLLSTVSSVLSITKLVCEPAVVTGMAYGATAEKPVLLNGSIGWKLASPKYSVVVSLYKIFRNCD